VDLDQRARVRRRRGLLVGLGALAVVAAGIVFWTSAWWVDWSTCDVVADSIELLDCSTTRWNAPAVVGSLLLLASGVAFAFWAARQHGAVQREAQATTKQVSRGSVVGMALASLLLCVAVWSVWPLFFGLGWVLAVPLALCSVALAVVAVRWSRGGWRVVAWALLALSLSPFVGLAASYLPQADPPRVVIACDVISSQYDGVNFDSLADARASGRSQCLGFVQDGTFTEVERQALAAASAVEDEFTLRFLYGICAQNGAVTLAGLPSPPSAEQAREISAALVLCPDHPDRPALQDAVSSAVPDTSGSLG